MSRRESAVLTSERKGKQRGCERERKSGSEKRGRKEVAAIIRSQAVKSDRRSDETRKRGAVKARESASVVVDVKRETKE